MIIARSMGIFGTDVKGIESVGTLGREFEQVYFGLRKFLTQLIVAVIAHSWRRGGIYEEGVMATRNFFGGSGNFS